MKPIPPAYYVSFGPHGPREPVLAPGAGVKIFGGTVLAVLTAVAIFSGIRSFGSKSPTVTKEWEEATAELGKEQSQSRPRSHPPESQALRSYHPC